MDKTLLDPCCIRLIKRREVSLHFYGSSLERARAKAHPRDSHQPELCQFLQGRCEETLHPPTNRSLRWVEHGVKNNHAMSCVAENRGHLRILRRFSKETELRSIASP